MNWNGETVRELEQRSIRGFVARHRGLLRGRVLDFGAGKPGTCRQPQPYRDLVEGDYSPYDLGDEVPFRAPQYDAILCTQVLQYVPWPNDLLREFRRSLREGGHLVMTYPTNWDEVESTDLWRFTRAGMERLLRSADFSIAVHERRAEIDLNGFKFPLGYGVVACR